jgi:predicted  nucleic acid-binding Zn-ribbon protein
MGPTNVALVKLYRANEALREAQGRLDAAGKNIRVQERKVNDLAEKVKQIHSELLALQSKGGQLELDIKTREARIEKLRLQQQNTTKNSEYQVFLLEIGSEKVDRGKSEDELLKVMESVKPCRQVLRKLPAISTPRRKSSPH